MQRQTAQSHALLSLSVSRARAFFLLPLSLSFVYRGRSAECWTSKYSFFPLFLKRLGCLSFNSLFFSRFWVHVLLQIFTKKRRTLCAFGERFSLFRFRRIRHRIVVVKRRRRRRRSFLFLFLASKVYFVSLSLSLTINLSRCISAFF
jgi:hypothetical protein